MTELRSYQVDAIEAIRAYWRQGGENPLDSNPIVVSSHPNLIGGGFAMSGKMVDHAGRRFGMWTVVSFYAVSSQGAARWLCRCECGCEKVVPAGSFVRGKSKSCGCSSQKMRSEKCRKHGHTRLDGYVSATYRSWHSMRQRCENKSHMSFRDYGGRGINVCDRWKTFTNFLSDMGERPDGKTLDRKRVNEGYSPDNCRWSTHSEQTANRRPQIKNGDLIELIAAVRKVASCLNFRSHPAIGELVDALSTFEGAR